MRSRHDGVTLNVFDITLPWPGTDQRFGSQFFPCLGFDGWRM